MTKPRGGWGLHTADPAERGVREGLCQLSDDVMIYFEEVMSGLCSEAGGVYGGTALVVHTGCTTSVQLNRHVWTNIRIILKYQL